MIGRIQAEPQEELGPWSVTFMHALNNIFQSKV